MFSRIDTDILKLLSELVIKGRKFCACPADKSGGFAMLLMDKIGF